MSYQKPVEGRRRATTLDMTQNRDTSVKAKIIHYNLGKMQTVIKVYYFITVGSE